MKATSGINYISYFSLIWSLDVSGYLIPRSERFIPVNRFISYSTLGWVCPSAVLEGTENLISVGLRCQHHPL